MPAITELVRGRSGGEPEGNQADDEAGEIHQQVGGVRHHRKTPCEISTLQRENTLVQI